LHHFDEAIANLALSSRSSENLCFYYEHFTKVHSCILGPMVWNTEKILSDEYFPGIILKSLFGYRDKIYIVQFVGYLLFLVTIGSLYFRSITSGNHQNVKSKIITSTPERN